MSKTEGIIIVFYFYLIFYEQLIFIACWSRSMSCLAKSFQQGNVFSKTEYLISLNVWTCAGIVVVKVALAEERLGSFILRNIMFKKKTLGHSPGLLSTVPKLCGEFQGQRQNRVLWGVITAACLLWGQDEWSCAQFTQPRLHHHHHIKAFSISAHLCLSKHISLLFKLPLPSFTSPRHVLRSQSGTCFGSICV